MEFQILHTSRTFKIVNDMIEPVNTRTIHNWLEIEYIRRERLLCKQTYCRTPVYL